MKSISKKVKLARQKSWQLVKKEGIGLDYYSVVMAALERYFHDFNWRKLFLSGGCYWLADMLHRKIDASIIMINRAEEHCALYFENALYDVRGKISQKNFREAGERDIGFMKKNYVPKFDVEKLEKYLKSLPTG